MAAGETDVGTGLTITYGGTFTAEILRIAIDGIEVPVADISHLASTVVRQKIAGVLRDAGVLTADVHWKGNEKPALTSGNRTARLGTTLSIGVPDGSTWAWTLAIYSQFSCEAPLEDPMTGTAVFVLNSDFTVT